MENTFTANIKSVLEKHFGKKADDVFDQSQLIQYINEKTRSANKGSKSRSSFANLFAVYVIIEDYIAKGYDQKGNYSSDKGAVFSQLFSRQRLQIGWRNLNEILNLCSLIGFFRLYIE